VIGQEAPRLAALTAALSPRSVAVVGVSEDPSKYGTRIARSMVEGEFPGPLHFINRREGSYLGKPFMPSLTSIGEQVDLVIVSVPSAHCAGVCREAAQIGAGCAVVVANGFAEIGPEGAGHQADLADVVASTGLRIIGPNAAGIVSTPSLLSGLGDATIPAGRIAVVAQSGNVAINMYHAARGLGLGLSHLVSLGNQVDVSFEDVLDHLAEDPHTDVLTLYIEGVRDLPRLLEAVARVSRRKPVLVLRGARTESGARAAASHTGSLADDDAILGAALTRAGALDVENMRELVLGAMALSDPVGPARGPSVSIVADGGGHATLAADAASRGGLAVEPHPEALERALRELLVPQAAVSNPVDLIGGLELREDIYQATVEACLADPGVDAAMLVGGFGGWRYYIGESVKHLEISGAKALVEARKRIGKPLVVQTLFANEDHEALDVMRAGGVPVVDEVDDAVRLLRFGSEYERRRDRARTDWPRGVPAGMGTALMEHESRAWLAERAPDLGGGDWEVVDDEEAAVAAAARLGPTVVLKLLSSRALHKSDVGGVQLDLRQVDMAAAWRRLAELAAGLGDSPCGLVMPQERGPVEALVGLYRHAAIGPVVVVGSGGIYTEALRDRALLFPPLGPDEVAEALAGLRLHDVLASPRSADALTEELVRVVVAVGELAVAAPELLELDLNPVLLTGRGARLLDVRVVAA
jgi:acetyltransferase